MTTYIHDPQAELDYAIDWSRWLLPEEQIATHVVTASDGITVRTEATGSRITAWIAGGDVGTVATITCHITTNQRRADDRSIRLLIRNR